MKIFTSLNRYLESESLTGNIQHLNLNSRKMLFCTTVKKAELSVTSTVHLFYFCYCSFHKHTVLIFFIHTFLDI